MGRARAAALRPGPDPRGGPRPRRPARPARACHGRASAGTAARGGIASERWAGGCGPDGQAVGGAGHGLTWRELGHRLGWPYRQVGPAVRALVVAGWLTPGSAPGSLRPGPRFDLDQAPGAAALTGR